LWAYRLVDLDALGALLQAGIDEGLAHSTDAGSLVKPQIPLRGALTCSPATRRSQIAVPKLSCKRLGMDYLQVGHDQRSA